MKHLLTVVWLLAAVVSYSQDHGFAYGKATYRELDLKQYDKDTSAVAVVLEEFGEAYMDNFNDHNLLLEYHVRIKVLKKAGVGYANIEVPLRKVDGKAERIRTASVRASSYNFENGSLKETKFDTRGVFTENHNKYTDVTKFAIPNVREGSVIEYAYILESPFIYNFREWEFQTDIPKVSSEYWANVPGNFIFNISLTGYLKLSKSESEVVRECYSPGGGNRADCARYKWAMTDIPAFKEEEYMTARTNFVSRIKFELSEVEYFDGRKDKVTKEWKDAEEEMARDDRFGVQIKRGKDIVDQHVALLMASEPDSLKRAQKIFTFIQQWYRWNGVYGVVSEFGIKKAFDKREGNVADINLSLVAALRYAGFFVEPLILSTRANGLPTELHPVLSDFNYVVAKLNLRNKIYLLDATDDFLPFGLIAERCLNGKGRVFGEKGSYWQEITPQEKSRRVTVFSLKLGADGVFEGTWQTNYSGYEAVDMRKEIASHADTKAFINQWSNQFREMEVGDFQVTNADDLQKALVIKLEVRIPGFDPARDGVFLFNPFMTNRRNENPFKSSERLYPVDFGVPKEEILIFNLEYPPDFEPVDLPAKVGLALPNAGGRFMFDIQNTGNKLALNSSLLISRTVFSSQEYHYLKELFNRVIAVQQGELVFKKKS